MRDYVIITDSTSDIPEEIAIKNNIVVIPMSFIIDDICYNHYPDFRELSMKDFYDMLRKGKTSRTTQINSVVYYNYFENIIKSGKDVLYISFSSALSSTYQSSIIAKNELMEKYSENKIVAIDSKAASFGEALLVILAAQKKNEGMDIDSLSKWIECNYLKISQYFTVDDLNHLKRGGRMSAMTAFIGTALDIKPILHVNDEGKLIPVDKIRGRKKAIRTLLKNLIQINDDNECNIIFIGHGDCEEEARFLENLLIQNNILKEVIVHPIGPIIGSHLGPGAIVLIFNGKKR